MWWFHFDFNGLRVRIRVNWMFLIYILGSTMSFTKIFILISVLYRKFSLTFWWMCDNAIQICNKFVIFSFYIKDLKQWFWFKINNYLCFFRLNVIDNNLSLLSLNSYLHHTYYIYLSQIIFYWRILSVDSLLNDKYYWAKHSDNEEVNFNTSHSNP